MEPFFVCLDSQHSTPGCDQTGSLQSTPQLLSSVGKIKHFSFRLPTKSLTQFWKLTGKNRNNIDETCHTQNYVSSQKCTFKPSNSENGLTGLWTGLKELFGKIKVDSVMIKYKNCQFWCRLSLRFIRIPFNINIYVSFISISYDIRWLNNKPAAVSPQILLLEADRETSFLDHLNVEISERKNIFLMGLNGNQNLVSSHAQISWSLSIIR